jgi:hypothetical protein
MINYVIQVALHKSTIWIMQTNNLNILKCSTLIVNEGILVNLQSYWQTHPVVDGKSTALRGSHDPLGTLITQSNTSNATSPIQITPRPNSPFSPTSHTTSTSVGPTIPTEAETVKLTGLCLGMSSPPWSQTLPIYAMSHIKLAENTI